MKNKKVAALLAGTAFTAAMLSACGVYGSPEAADSEVIEEETETQQFFHAINPSDNPDSFDPSNDINIAVYGPPESFGNTQTLEPIEGAE